MNLDQQIQVLIHNAPQDGITPKVVEAIAPVLKGLAERLGHPQYYILQTLDQSWLVTTLSNRAQPHLEKKVIYAYPSLKDISAGSQSARDPQVVALPIPVIHILFQMIALETVDSTVFFDTPGNQETGTEIRRQDLQQLIQTQFQQRVPSSVPPHFA